MLISVAWLGYFGTEWPPGNQPARDQSIVVLIAIFDSFDSQKGRTQNDRQQQADDRVALLTNLRAVDSHGHCETAEDQDDGVDAAEANVEMVTCRRESRRVLIAINRVGQVQSTKEHDLS